MNETIDISVVIPVCNERSNIFELHLRLVHTLTSMGWSHEIVFVNDGGTDDSAEKIKKLAGMYSNVRHIGLSRNFGHQLATMAGLQHSLGQSVVIMDGDLQDPPELIEKLHEKYLEGHKVVYARRSRQRGEKWNKRMAAALFYRIMALITEIDIPLDTGHFRIMDREVVEKLRSMPESGKFLRGRIAWMGFSSPSMDFERDQRRRGKANYSYRKMFRLAMDGITGFSNAPLKPDTILGILFYAVGSMSFLYALWSTFILKSAVQGHTPLMILGIFMGGIQLVCLGIMGEYIGRINLDVRRRPLYIVEETKNVIGTGSPSPVKVNGSRRAR